MVKRELEFFPKEEFIAEPSAAETYKGYVVGLWIGASKSFIEVRKETILNRAGSNLTNVGADFIARIVQVWYELEPQMKSRSDTEKEGFMKFKDFCEDPMREQEGKKEQDPAAHAMEQAIKLFLEVRFAMHILKYTEDEK